MFKWRTLMVTHWRSLDSLRQIFTIHTRILGFVLLQHGCLKQIRNANIKFAIILSINFPVSTDFQMSVLQIGPPADMIIARLRNCRYLN